MVFDHTPDDLELLDDRGSPVRGARGTACAATRATRRSQTS